MPSEPSYKTLERRSEEIYPEMYERGSPLGLLSEIKECFAGAIGAAEADGLAAEARGCARGSTPSSPSIAASSPERVSTARAFSGNNKSTGSCGALCHGRA